VSESLKQKTVRGMIWSGISSFSNQAIQFVIGLIVARILLPSDYGLIGMVTVFTSLITVFIDCGFSTALVRKIDRTDADFSTAFYFNIVAGAIVYLIIFFTAPLIAEFYNEPQITSLARFLGINVFLGAFGIVQGTQYTIKVDFKTPTKISIISLLCSGSVGICLAYAGYGVWAIAWQFVVNKIVSVILIWFYSSWRPKLIFSKVSLHYMWSFGYKMVLSALLDTLYGNIYQIIIGKVFSAKDLGNYSRARQFASFPSSNFTGIIGSVTFPILSSIQNDDTRLERVYRKYLCLSAFIVFPCMVGLSVLANPVVVTLLSERWLECVPLLQIICFSMMWYPIHAINLHLLQVKGRSDLFLRLEIIKKIMGVTILCITVPMGLVVMCIGSIFGNILGLVVNTYYTGKLINVGYWRQMCDLLPILFLSLAMGAVVYMSVLFIPSNIVKLFVGVVVGGIFYIVVARIFRMEELTDLFSLVKRKK
jgi:O-antigen/teichoic acid export membrane protein